MVHSAGRGIRTQIPTPRLKVAYPWRLLALPVELYPHSYNWHVSCHRHNRLHFRFIIYISYRPLQIRTGKQLRPSLNRMCLPISPVAGCQCPGRNLNPHIISSDYLIFYMFPPSHYTCYSRHRTSHTFIHTHQPIFCLTHYCENAV